MAHYTMLLMRGVSNVFQSVFQRRYPPMRITGMLVQMPLVGPAPIMVEMESPP